MSWVVPATIRRLNTSKRTRYQGIQLQEGRHGKSITGIGAIRDRHLLGRGKTLEDAISAMNPGGRIPVCGQIAGYNTPLDQQYGVKNLFQLVAKSITMQGFLSMAYFKYDEEVRKVLGGWIADGSLKTTFDIREGIEGSAKCLIDIFEGRNYGKAICKISDA